MTGRTAAKLLPTRPVPNGDSSRGVFGSGMQPKTPPPFFPLSQNFPLAQNSVVMLYHALTSAALFTIEKRCGRDGTDTFVICTCLHYSVQYVDRLQWNVPNIRIDPPQQSADGLMALTTSRLVGDQKSVL